MRRRGCFARAVVWRSGGLTLSRTARRRFDASWNAIEAACPGTHRSQRGDTDWGEELTRSGLFGRSQRTVVPWVRQVSIDRWLTDTRSHSFVAALAPKAQDQLVGVFAGLLFDAFPDGEIRVPYETWLWTATRA